MKVYLTLILFCLSFVSNARFDKAIVLFNDGHSEAGFVKSFLEQRVMSGGFTNNLEHELNLDDKIVKFKSSEETEVKDLSIEDIKQVTLLYDNNYTAIYRALILKEIDKKGNFKETSRKVFLPLLKEGKINIYGLKYYRGNGSVPYEGEVFYYQNAKENYAVNYYNMGFSVLFNTEERVLNPLRSLFNDCPSVLKELDIMESKMESSTKEERKAKREEQRNLMKEFDKLEKEEKNKLLVIHHYRLNSFENLINLYENCN